MDLPVVNHEDYFAKIGDDHKFPINKFGELANYLIKNKIVKKAYEDIKQICIDLQKQTNCPEEDLKDFLEFISKQWTK